ncbi:OsmC family protein [Prolixibacter sp. NT017]|uniref:OsmC family protein n=1 Tax=Prolixibacter sp. NT017 TaxID=2652390 RepID=UPI00127F3C3F|nr:OsmC family protein [Prolixibacter sp. NT017]GET25737.1 peroxiredoxin [Prolixibacter sp. NT017]
MKHEVGISWKEDMAFEAEVNGHKIMLDADEKVGGKDRGPRPKPFMLTALAGCTAMDVISILKKMRVTPDNFDVKVSGELGEEHPKVYTSMHITYQFWGEDLPMEKLEKAVNLSQDRYCGVSAIYRKALPITSSIEVNPKSK